MLDTKVLSVKDKVQAKRNALTKKSIRLGLDLQSAEIRGLTRKVKAIKLKIDKLDAEIKRLDSYSNELFGLWMDIIDAGYLTYFEYSKFSNDFNLILDKYGL